MNQPILPLVIGFGIFVAAACVGYAVVATIRARSSRPSISPSDILFQESFASGYSTQSFLTRFGGANNCLRLIVTQDYLLITSWFPFSLFIGFYDLEHAVPRTSIRSVEPASMLWHKGVRIAFVGDDASQHAVVVFPRDLEKFLTALDFRGM